MCCVGSVLQFEMSIRSLNSPSYSFNVVSNVYTRRASYIILVLAIDQCLFIENKSFDFYSFLIK